MEYDPTILYRYDELTALVQQLAAEHPTLVQLQSIGQSPQGRQLWLLEITNQNTGPADEKPATWVDGNTHASELAGSAAALFLAHSLVRQHGTHEETTFLLDTRAVYILPRLSPDGAEHCLTTGDFIRSSPRPYPMEDRWEGLLPQDVNGDGFIVQMRMQSPHGEWKVSTQDDRLLIRRRPDDREGPFYHVYREGVLENWDGYRIDVPPSPYGMDFNRNYPFEWAPEHKQKGAGPYPLSEPETRAVVDFVSKHRNISVVHTFHTYSAAILRPFSTRPDEDMADMDLAMYKTLGARGTDLTGYPCLSTYHDFRYGKESIRGGFDDWCYEHCGIFAFTTEIWSIGKAAGLPITDHMKFLMERTEDETLAILRHNDAEDYQGFVPWTAFEHPQLGPVEIGGWKLLHVWSNPPARLLPGICEKVAAWVVATALATPRLAIEKFEAEDLVESRPRLRKVTLKVVNEGWLPTHGSSRALETRTLSPPQVTLHLESGAEVVLGRQFGELPHLAGVANVVADGPDNPVYFRGVSQGHRDKMEWLIRGEGPIGVTVKSERAGTVRATAEETRDMHRLTAGNGHWRNS